MAMFNSYVKLPEGKWTVSKTYWEKIQNNSCLVGLLPFWAACPLYSTKSHYSHQKMSSVPISLGSDGIKQPASASRATGSDSKDFTPLLDLKIRQNWGVWEYLGRILNDSYWQLLMALFNYETSQKKYENRKFLPRKGTSPVNPRFFCWFLVEQNLHPNLILGVPCEFSRG